MANLYMSPTTSSAMTIASMALMGLPFMAGYYSKHSIMTSSLVTHMNYVLYMLMMLAILLTSAYTMRLILFTMIKPPAQQPLSSLDSTYNTHIPLIRMSLMSTMAGSTMQWMLPLTPTTTSMNDNLESTTMSLIIIMGMSLMTAKISTKSTKPAYQLINKFYTSMGFLTPTSTQFPLPVLMNLSMKLYKNLDQAWLEKTSALGMSNLISNLGVSLSLSMLMKPQQSLLLNSLASSTLIMTIMAMALL